MLKFIFSIAALVILLTSTVSAEIYQYTDEGGVVRFTDDSSLIPEDQRSDVETLESVQSTYSPEEVVQQASSQSEETGAGKVRNSASELDAIREDLLREYNALEAEKKTLGDPPPKNSRSGIKADYTYKVTELNRRIDDYEKRYKDFDEKIKAFNAQIGQ